MRAVSHKLVIKPMLSNDGLITNLDEYHQFPDCRYGTVVSVCERNPLNLEPGDILVFNHNFQNNVYFTKQYFLGIELGLDDIDTYWVVAAASNNATGPFGYFRGLDYTLGTEIDSMPEWKSKKYFTPFPGLILASPHKDYKKTQEYQRTLEFKRLNQLPGIVGADGGQMNPNDIINAIKSAIVFKKDKCLVYKSGVDTIKEGDVLSIDSMAAYFENIAGFKRYVINYNEDVFAKE